MVRFFKPEIHLKNFSKISPRSSSLYSSTVATSDGIPPIMADTPEKDECYSLLRQTLNISSHTFVILRPVEAEDLLVHVDSTPDLITDSVRGDGHFSHHGIRLSEQPHVPIVDRPVAGQTALMSVFFVEGSVSDEGSQDLVMKPNLGEVVTKFCPSSSSKSNTEKKQVPFRKSPTF